jgi:mRNA-degrading endonuclease RelE of RelBE toxin-antitoxin system
VTGKYELCQTDTFKTDLKSLDGRTKETLKRILYRLLENPTRFKPLKGKPQYYRIRLGVHRLVYKTENKKITLMYIKKRDIVYTKI